MAYPDFSEFSFGYAVVRQIEESFGGKTVVPSFPTQPQEFDGGYDVDFLSHGIPLFIQFKRSEVMRRKSCKEFKDNKANLAIPIFRMHLHENHQFKQHFLMQDLEAKGNAAIYCTSAVVDKQTLDSHYGSGTVFGASAIFRPSEIAIPSLNEHHHVSFNPGIAQACVYSATGFPFSRSLLGFGSLLGQLQSHLELSPTQELEKLRDVENDFETLGTEQMAARRRRQYKFAISEQGDGEEPIAEMTAMERDLLLGARRARIRGIQSLVKRIALEAYFEMDAMLTSVSRKAIS